MRLSTLTATVVLLVLGLQSDFAAGQGPPRAQVRAVSLTHGARAIVDRGVQALAVNDLPTARRLLTDAYRQSQRSEVLYHLGRLAVAEGRALEAYDLMQRYLADPSREVDAAATHAAEELVAPPPPPSGSLTIISDPGALVLLDQRVVATLPLLQPLLVSPGGHTVRLEFSTKNLEAPVQVELDRRTEVRMSRATGTVLVSVLPAILLWSTGPALSPELTRQLVGAVDQAAHDEQYTLLRADKMFKSAAEYQRCQALLSCQRERANEHSIELMLQQSAQVDGAAPGQAWKFQLRFLRADIAEPAATVDKLCNKCTAAQAAVSLKEAAAQALTQGLSRPRGSLHLIAEPAAASVRIGDRPALPAPYTAAAWTGSYEVTASHPGYQSASARVEVESGKTAELQLVLQRLAAAFVVPGAPQPRGRAPRPRWRLGVGATLIAVGLGLGIAGGVGLSLNNTCIDSVPDVNCRQLYDTGVVGGLGLGGGLALIGAGVVLIALPGPSR